MEICCECGTENLGEYEVMTIDVKDDLYLCVACASARISSLQSRLDAKSAEVEILQADNKGLLKTVESGRKLAIAFIQVKKALVKFGRHLPMTCEIIRYPVAGSKCTCGLDAAKER